jgi:hypothetical protein
MLPLNVRTPNPAETEATSCGLSCAKEKENIKRERMSKSFFM